MTCFQLKWSEKKGNDLSPLLSNIALYYSLRKVQVNQDSLKLNGTYQVVVYVDDINILRGRVQTVKENIIFSIC